MDLMGGGYLFFGGVEEARRQLVRRRGRATARRGGKDRRRRVGGCAGGRETLIARDRGEGRGKVAKGAATVVAAKAPQQCAEKRCLRGATTFPLLGRHIVQSTTREDKTTKDVLHSVRLQHVTPIHIVHNGDGQGDQLAHYRETQPLCEVIAALRRAEQSAAHDEEGPKSLLVDLPLSRRRRKEEKKHGDDAELGKERKGVGAEGHERPQGRHHDAQLQTRGVEGHRAFHRSFRLGTVSATARQRRAR